MSLSGLTISKLARAAEVNVETIRYYQRVGLITQPEKPNHGYRRYPDQTVSKIRFIKRAQRLGFALKDIEELIKLSEGQYDAAKELAQEKLSVIEEHIADLLAMRATLQDMINAQDSGEISAHETQFNKAGDKSCAIIEALTDESKLRELAEGGITTKTQVSSG